MVSNVILVASVSELWKQQQQRVFFLYRLFGIVADDILKYKYILKNSEKIRLDISCESSARQMIHMKCQAWFSNQSASNEYSQHVFMENKKNIYRDTPHLALCKKI